MNRIQAATCVASIAAVLLLPASDGSEDHLVQISRDRYTDTSGQHATEVEPTLARGGETLVAAFQVGRHTGVGADNIGWSTSQDEGKHWSFGVLDGTTTLAAGNWPAVSLPTISYDRKHGLFLIQMLAFGDDGLGHALLISRSADGLHWSHVETSATSPGSNSDWIACDNHRRSPFYGNCYAAWDDEVGTNNNNLIVSVDGGRTWGSAATSPDRTAGLVTSIAIQPSGQVVLLGRSGGANSDQEYAIRSQDGGHSLEPTNNIATSQFDYPYLRADPTPTSAVAKDGTIYVVFADCRFRAGCLTAAYPTNDLVVTRSKDAIHWSDVSRIPIDSVTSTVDHIIPGLAIHENENEQAEEDESQIDGRDHPWLALTYYSIDNGVACIPDTCDLNANVIQSHDGGRTWQRPQRIAGPMQQKWLASTYAGQMVSDYLRPVFLHDELIAAFALARKPDSPSALDESIFVTRVDGGEGR